MAEYDFFEITGLSFDPAEKAAKKIKVAIDKAEKSLGGMLGSVSQQAQRDEINGKLALLSKIKGEVLSEDGKVLPRFKEIADERKESAKKRLESAIRLEKLSKLELVVTNGKIKTQKKNTRLSKESIEEVYKNYGFTILDIDPLVAMPKFPTNSEKIYSELEILRGSKDPNPNGADLTKASDLYSFAAYLKGEPENASEYRDMPTKDIANLFDEYSKKNSMRNDPLGKLCVSIATAGKTNVFNNEANRKAYEQFLLYKSPELIELFSIIKDSVQSDLRDPSFADVCIKKITEVFGDSNVALAIYHNEAGLRDDPYIPEKASFSVKCAHCQNVSEFATYEEAKRINSCKHCGKSLYKTCTHCNKIILDSANRCTECGFVFANVGLFTKYISLAESALKQGKLDEAREQLIRAKTADPNEHTQTASLEKRLESEEAKIAEPIKKLRVLMTSRQYEAAEDFLADIVKKYPQVNLTDQKKEISSVLSECRSKFEACKNLQTSAKVNACLEILDLCEDFRLASEVLDRNPPSSTSGIRAVYDDDKKSVVISWNKSNEPGITYRLLRKNGNALSIGIDDGIWLKEGSETSFNDTSVSAGKQYSYTVFVIRKGSASEPVSIRTKTLSGVNELRSQQKESTLIISWRLPENSQGALVKYEHGGKNYTVADNAHQTAEIKNITYGSPYTIYVYANYGNLGNSEPKQITATPTPMVSSFRISAGQAKDGNCAISWSINERNVDLQILVDGRIVQNTSSELKSCTLNFPANNHYKVQVKAFSGGQWILSENELVINTYESVQIDDEASTISESTRSSAKGMVHQIEIKIKLEDNIPGNVVALYCFVRTKEPGVTKAPWATESDVNGNSDRIDYDTYLQWHEITKQITAHDEDAYYVTVFSVYKVDGKEILSAPCKKKFNRPLEANIFWKARKPLIGGGKLLIEIESNRPLVRRPELILCASPSGKHLLSENDSSAVELARINEEIFDSPRMKFSESFDISFSAKKNTKVFLFVKNESNSGVYSVRWLAGYEGKL